MQTDNTQTIYANIEANKKLFTRITHVYANGGIPAFLKNVERYIEAIRQGRMINSIQSVSASGMSRVIYFTSSHYNGIVLFTFRGYSPTTAKHIRYVNSACSHLTKVYCYDPH